jgi:hypothetical protein
MHPLGSTQKLCHYWTAPSWLDSRMTLGLKL